jgi:hypothetical protein
MIDRSPTQDSWRDISAAQKLLLHHMKEQGWPEEYITALTLFFHPGYRGIRKISALGDEEVVVSLYLVKF